jgi:hypothetical protein
VALRGRTIPDYSGKFNPIQVDSGEFNQNENKNSQGRKYRLLPVNTGQYRLLPPSKIKNQMACPKAADFAGPKRATANCK